MAIGADRLRPAWKTLPPQLRERAVALIGGGYVDDVPTQGGFSAGYAGIVTTTTGRAFVKAVEAGGHADSAHFLAAEIEVLQRLPPGLAPRVVGSVRDDAGLALVLEAIDGRHPGHPWTTDDLRIVAEALASVATTPAPHQMTTAEEAMQPSFLRWGDIATDPGLLADLPLPVQERVPLLLEIEQEFPAVVRGDMLVHNDVRADNVLITDCRARLLDWPHARRGAPWLDLPCLLPSVEADGGPACEEAWPLFEEYGAPSPRVLLPVISGFASFLWYEQGRPEFPQLPGLRAFQRAQALPALRWLRTLL